MDTNFDGGEVLTQRKQLARGNFLPLSGIVLVALAVRLTYLCLKTGALDWEGAEYARTAENLLAGAGFVGIDLPGKSLVFPPLFSFVAAFVALFTRDAEASVRIVSVLSGAALVLPVFRIATRHFGSSSGYVAAALIALHPLLVAFSTQGCSETFYSLLIAVAALATLRAATEPSLFRYILAGSLFGLSYLTRVEALPVMLVGFLMLLFTVARGGAGATVASVRTLALPLAFLVVISPYLAFVHHETGQWRLEGKSPINVATLQRQWVEGMSPERAQHEIDGDLAEIGTWMTPAAETINREHFGSMDSMKMFVKRAVHGGFRRIAGDFVRDFSLGSPALLLLAGIGLVAAGWGLQRAAVHVFLASAIGTGSLLSLLVNHANVRMYLACLPFLIIFAARGVVASADGCRLVIESVAGKRIGARVPTVIACLLAMAPIALAAFGLKNVYALTAFDERSRWIEQAGQWLDEYAPGHKLLADDRSQTLAFHAHADYLPMPYTDSDTALRYFDKRGVDFIAVWSDNETHTPYLPGWYAGGVPSARARLVHEATDGRGYTLRIYEWRPTSPR